MKAVISHQYHGVHPPSPTPATKISIPVSAGGGAEAALLGKGRYKAWALVAIALLALWSMFAASVTLRWSSGDLAAASRDLNGPLIDDLDPLEMEERENLVRRMWDLYTRTGDHVWLPRFWQEAFEAAYEELAGDDLPASDAAVSEIARMAIHRPELEQHCIFTFRKFIATAKTRTEIEYTTRDVIAITIMCSQKQYTVNIWRSGGPSLQGE